ncbi:hypothetical protein CYMTET_27485 [Cymbomonas tetramitiformis]|uniref:F-box domain-containing protein n=1 Tax=Cymbomonas tetramitiformis TaxID=36881 RepID=A0AAE0FPS4_9CHLO|nr:hypothetical protein CYMTET_27485 [Cymbomonas tetramitiformis]
MAQRAVEKSYLDRPTRARLSGAADEEWPLRWAFEDGLPQIPEHRLSSLPAEIGVDILQRVDLAEVLRLRAASRGAKEWVDLCLPGFTQLRWSTSADSLCVERALYRLVQQCGLRVEKLEGCFYKQSSRFPALSLLATSCMTELVMRHSQCVDGFSLTVIADCCPALQVLDVHGCVDISSQSVCEVAVNRRQLSRVDVGECLHVTDVAICCLAQCCSDLRYLNVDKCREVSNKSIHFIGLHCRRLQAFVGRSGFLQPYLTENAAAGCGICLSGDVWDPAY